MSANITTILNTRPQANTSLPNAIGAALRNHQMDIESMIPAQVVSYDRGLNTATIKPMIMRVDVNDNNISRFQLIKIPVISMGGGGFHINFPLKQGDLGWIHASDRDISLFLQTLQESHPPGSRFHTFESGMFVPDVFRQYTINGADSAAMVIQSTDGNTRISISAGTINITAPSAVGVTTPMATFSTNVHVKGTLLVDQQISANGGFNATGGGNLSCVLPQMTTINGITVATHGHQQQNNGSGRTAAGMIT
jgi:Phage protein Gp138 N-terminal domain